MTKKRIKEVATLAQAALPIVCLKYYQGIKSNITAIISEIRKAVPVATLPHSEKISLNWFVSSIIDLLAPLVCANAKYAESDNFKIIYLIVFRDNFFI
jgi:hypothetical protein